MTRHVLLSWQPKRGYHDMEQSGASWHSVLRAAQPRSGRMDDGQRSGMGLFQTESGLNFPPFAAVWQCFPNVPVWTGMWWAAWGCHRTVASGPSEQHQCDLSWYLPSVFIKWPISDGTSVQQGFWWPNRDLIGCSDSKKWCFGNNCN